jgi:small neutral amino acid transporter SnatA (MarC family)
LTGNIALSRLLGVLLAALAVQMRRRQYSRIRSILGKLNG